MIRCLNIPVFITLWACFQLAYTQEKSFVYKPFATMHLINSQTTETVAKNGYEFVIQHKFGNTDLTDRPFYNLLGMDKSTNIRFGFDIALAKNWTVGVGRTKSDKTFDTSTKYRFLRQTTDNSMPVSAAILGTLFYRSADFPKVRDNYFYTDSTAFSYEKRHRYNYEAAILISRKMTPWITLQVAPTFIRQNLVEPDQENNLFIMPVGGRLNVGLFSSVLFEYSSNLTDQAIYPDNWALAYEIKTSTHAFQIHISSNQAINNHAYYSSTDNAEIAKGSLFLGFTINKLFWIKK